MQHENRHTYFKLATEDRKKCGLAQLKKNGIFRKEMIYKKPTVDHHISVLKQFDLVSHEVEETRDKIVK